MATGFEEAKMFDAEVQGRKVEIMKKQKMEAVSRHKQILCNNPKPLDVFIAPIYNVEEAPDVTIRKLPKEAIMNWLIV